MIDWDRLNGLRSEIGEEDFREVAELFVEELSEMVERLLREPATATAGDFHFLRGSAANLGFSQFAAQCASAEIAVARGETPDIQALADIYAKSLAEAASLLPDAVRAA